MGFQGLSLVSALFCFATSAAASTISISSFSSGAYNSAMNLGDTLVTEDFEGHTVGNMTDGFSTSVGTFATLGGTGSGGTVSGANFANNGNQLAVRDGGVFGRTSTSAILQSNNTFDQFLDSNDTFGIAWSVDLGGRMFDRLVLTMTDAADVGAAMHVSMGATSEILASANNGNRQLVVINFDTAVNSATINFENRSGGGRLTNDGFSLDDFAVRVVPASVPLPAGLLLMGTALAGLGVARRRRR